MKVCVPTQEDKGMASVAFGHFGSAPYFILCDTELGETQSISNNNQHHAHGACNPLTALGGTLVEALIVGGIGKRAVEGLNALGIIVYQAVEGTVQKNIDALKKGDLAELTMQNACGGHGHGAGCGH